MRIFWILFLALPCLSRAESEEEALFLRRIADFWQEGEYQIAKTQMEEFIVDYPESPFSDALCAALGDLFLRDKNFSSALNYYSQVQSPEFLQKIFLNRMQCLYEMQWYATLADECEAYLSAHSDIHVTYFLAIALYQQCINASKETDQFLKLAERAKPYFETLYKSELSQEIAQGYAHLSCLLKDYAKATEVYFDLAEKNPSLEEEMLFQVALIQSEYDKTLALETFDKIGQMGKNRAKEAVFNRMVLAFELGRFEELASPDLLQQMPKDRLGIARLFLGRSLLQLKRYEEAVQELKAYLEQAPVSETFFAALLSLLDASYQAGDLASLDEAIHQLMVHDPQNSELPKAYLSRAQLLKRAERFQEAEKELEELLATFPEFPQKAQVLFELTHLDFKAKKWEECYKKGLQFLAVFKDHELSPFVWRYFVSSSAEMAMQKPEHKQQLLSDLTAFLHLPLKEEEKNEWELLLAKTHYELGQYESAMECLKSQNTPNASLLLALCHRDGHHDTQAFCKLAEEAISREANLVDLGKLHASLYNAYLELSNPDKAAEHLYEAFMAKAELKLENLLWLADLHYQRLLEDEGNFILAARTATLLEKCRKDAYFEPITCKLARVYSLLGKIEEAITLIESLSSLSPEAELILAENYIKKGILDRAEPLLDAILKQYGTGRTPIAAEAALVGARLKLSKPDPNFGEIATQLKNLVLQKNFEGEPLYLEAALEYVALAAQDNPAKKITLLQKTKEDFEERGDLLSKDYHAAREKLPRKNLLYQGYMKLIDAEIALNEAKIHPHLQKDLRAKSKDLLLQIMKTPAASSLKERAQKLLADET